MDPMEQNHFELVKQRVSRLVENVRIVPMELPEGAREWCFSPGTEEEREILELLEIWDRWEDRERSSILSLFPERRQEIQELMRIVRSKIALNRTNRHFMGYLREGTGPQQGRDFYLTTFVRTVDHLAGIWGSAGDRTAIVRETPLTSEGS
jgi:hypothetical protein